MLTVTIEGLTEEQAKTALEFARLMKGQGYKDGWNARSEAEREIQEKEPRVKL